MKKFKRQKGITLIALVVTIVILIILATISINAVFGENGLIKMAEKAKVLNAIKEKEEEVQFAITELMLENNMDASKVTVSAVVDKVKQNYKDQKSKNSISGASNEEGSDNFPGYIQYDPPSSTVDQTIIVNVDENLNVSGYAGEPSGLVKPPKSEYTKTGNIYYNTPDLSGFNPENTYYVVYGKDGKNETVYGKTNKVEAPGTAEEMPDEFKDMVWHDYESKIWANVVTVNEEEVAYWTWIPRYKYKIDGTGKIVDIKFVNTSDECIEVVDGQEKVVDLQDYELPESFKFGKQDLQGYWVSKYEAQDSESISKELVQIITDKDENQILTTTSPNGNSYTIYLNGVRHKQNVQLPCRLSDLGIKSSYEIMVVREKDNKILGSTKGTLNYKIEVDLSGFNPENTYYVLYDKDGKSETIYGRMDKVKEPGTEEMPEEFQDMVWYDYEKKIWANLVSVKKEEVAYWTYIPRYEYRVVPENKYVDIRYIPVSQTEPDEGYTIPESFRFGEQDLQGYWVSKYEAQDSESISKELVQIITDNDGNQILTTTSPNGNSYTIYLNGLRYKQNVQLPCKLSDLGINSDYEIMVVREKDNKILGIAKGTLNYKIEVDLSGFNPENTYYVTYDDEGNEETVTDTKIVVDENGEATNAPDNWYNYEKKIWANIVTKGTDEDGKTELIAYWTYIPRYEYRIMPGSKYVDVRYIPVSQTEPDEGYIIPESFRFGEQDLKGYWVSKYEVQNK